MLSSLTFFGGIVLGFLISPIKHGIYNINDNTTNYYDDRKNNL